jgi:hypothetical protein
VLSRRERRRSKREANAEGSGAMTGEGGCCAMSWEGGLCRSRIFQTRIRLEGGAQEREEKRFGVATTRDSSYGSPRRTGRKKEADDWRRTLHVINRTDDGAQILIPRTKQSELRSV